MSDSEQPTPEKEPTIHLDQFLKTCGVATGGQAKRMVQAGEILVNGEVETRRRKQLRLGDEVDWEGIVYVVAGAEEAEANGSDEPPAEAAPSDPPSDDASEA